MNDMFGILDLIVLFAAFYIMMPWYQLKFKGEIKTGLLLNNEVNVEKCMDKEGYRKEAAPLLLILGIAAFADALVGIINSNVTMLPMPVTMGVLGIFLLVLVWFGFQSKKLYQKYWDTKKKSIKR